MAETRIFGNKWDFGCTVGDASLTKDAIKGMSLVENIFEPFWVGSLTVEDGYNLLDDMANIKGDGDDIFTISMNPEDIAPPLKFKGVINDETTDTSFQDRADMYKIFSIMDEGYFKLNVPIPYGKRYRGNIGAILKEIYEEYELPTGTWDEGDHEIDIFPEHILPPISFRVSDLVKYLVRINYKKAGETHVRTLLYWDRKEEAYVLKGLDTMFNDGKKCEEGFVAGEFGVDIPSEASGGDCKSTWKSLMHGSSLVTPCLTYTNEWFLNSLVSGYDPELGEHGIREIRLAEVKDKWETEIVKKLGEDVTPFLPDVMKANKTKLFRSFSFPFKLDNMAKLAEAELIANMTFYNLELALQNLGDIDRRAGMFASVDVNSVFENKKLIGNWLVTKVAHEFTNNSYYNTINMTKVYTKTNK